MTASISPDRSPTGYRPWFRSSRRSSGLKDEESARRLFYSNSFDFTGLGPQLIKKLVRELQASVGFYEVQTGQTIGQLYCAHLPAKLAWLQKTVSDMLGVRVLNMDFRSWLKELGITLAEHGGRRKRRLNLARTDQPDGRLHPGSG